MIKILVFSLCAVVWKTGGIVRMSVNNVGTDLFDTLINITNGFKTDIGIITNLLHVRLLDKSFF